MEAPSKAFVTVLLFAVMSHLGDGIKCYKCDYDQNTCQEGKVEEVKCKDKQDCLSHKTVSTDKSVTYEYDCAESGETSVLVSGIGTLENTHCLTDLCNTVVMQTTGKLPSTPTTPTPPNMKIVLIEITTQPTAAQLNNKGKNMKPDGPSGTDSSRQHHQNETMSKPNTTISVNKNTTNISDLLNKHLKGDAGNVGFSIFTLLLNLLIVFII